MRGKSGDGNSVKFRTQKIGEVWSIWEITRDYGSCHGLCDTQETWVNNLLTSFTYLPSVIHKVSKLLTLFSERKKSLDLDSKNTQIKSRRFGTSRFLPMERLRRTGVWVIKENGTCVDHHFHQWILSTQFSPFTVKKTIMFIILWTTDTSHQLSQLTSFGFTKLRRNLQSLISTNKVRTKMSNPTLSPFPMTTVWVYRYFPKRNRDPYSPYSLYN